MAPTRYSVLGIADINIFIGIIVILVLGITNINIFIKTIVLNIIIIRELAQQIEEETNKFGADLGIRSVAVIGGIILLD